MPKESNYFEEASLLFREQDPFVSRTAESLYQQMLAEHLRGNVPPQDGFNILYFFQTVVRLLLLAHPNIELATTTYPYRCSPIRATNWPDRLDQWGGNQPILERFSEFVKADSVPAGEDFDVSYAVRILSSAIDNDGKLRAPFAEPAATDPEFGYWLSGFNSGQP